MIISDNLVEKLITQNENDFHKAKINKSKIEQVSNKKQNSSNLRKQNNKEEMSHLTLSQQTFKWLQSIELVKQGKRNSQGKIQLDEKISGRFLDGVLVSRILLKIIQSQSEINQSLRNKMKSVKQNSTPAIRLYNWNLIVDVLKQYKFSLDYLQKSKILNLQTEPVEIILQYLRGIYYNENVLKINQSKGQKVVNINNKSSNKSLDKKDSILINNNNNTNSNKLEIDIKSLPTKTAKQANNILQLFTLLLSKHFKLSPQQTLNLYLDNNKYLALLIVKGIKQSYEPILAFINELMSLLEFVVLELFATNQEESLQFFFNCTKPSLISNNESVTTNCIKLYDNLYDTYVDNNIQKNNLLSWLRKQGCETLLFSTKQKDHLLNKSLIFLFKTLQQELFQFIRPIEKSPLWNDDKQKLTFYNTFLVVAQNNLLSTFQKSTCLMEWKQFLIKAMKKLKSPQQLHLLISILYQMWLLFPTMFDKPQVSNSSNLLTQNFFTLIKSVTISNDFKLFVHSVKIMFELMSILGKRKNSHAPSFYKLLCNCLQFQSSQQRVIFLADNFILTFNDIQTLPGMPLVQPMIRSLQRNPTSSVLNLAKYLIITHKLPQSECIELIDIMMKVIFEDYLIGKVAIQNLFESIQVLDQEIRQQFLLRNGMLCLAQFYSLGKMVKKSYHQLIQSMKKYQNQHHEIKQQGQNYNYLSQINRFLLIQNLIKFLLKIIQNKQNNQIMNQLQEHVFMTYLKVKIQLQKPQIAFILKHNILSKYYDIEQQLIAVIDQYQRRYRMYLEQNQEKDNYKKRSMSLQMGINQSEQQSLIQQNYFLSPSQSTSNNIISPSKPPNPSLFKPTNFAIKDLQSLKTKLSRIKAATQDKQKESLLIEEKNMMVRSIINERRLIKYGAKNTKDIDYKCLFQIDTVKPQKTINGLPFVQLIDLKKQQQDIFVADIQSLIKKYRKVWRFLFFKYSSFGAKNNTNKTNSQTKIEEKINISQIWKMHKQYGTDFIKKQQIFALVKMINEGMKRKNDLQNLTYLGFQQYIVQFCIFAYNRLGLTTLSPGQKVNKFLSQLKQVTQEKGGNSQIFTNPQQVYFLQTDVIKQYNRRLAINPDYILPEGYKKVKQTEFIYENEFTQNCRSAIKDINNNQNNKKSKNQPSHSNFKKQSYIDVLQVLDSILSEHPSLGFHLIQPKTSKIQRTLAKPALFQQITQKMKTYKQGYLMPKKRQVNSTYISGRQQQKVIPVIIKPQFHPMIEFSLGIKLGLSAIPMKNKYIGQQVAYWMDDMLDAVENGAKKVQNKAQKRIQNQAIKNKRRVLFNLKNEMKQKQKLYKQRSQSVRSQFEKIQLIKQQINKKRVQQSIAKKKQQKLREQNQMRKKLAQFQKAKKFFSQRQEKQKQRQQQQQQAKRKQKQQYKKKVQQYFKLKKSQLQQKQMNFKKQKQYQLKKQKQQQQKKKQFTKKAYLAVLKKDQQTLDKIQTFKQKYQQFSQQQFVRKQFQQNRKSLTLFFQLLVKYEKSKISMTQKQQISQATFNYFALKFNIVPLVLEKNSLGKILISLWKNDQRGGGMKGMDYRQFEQALLRVIVKGKQGLNMMVEQRKKRKLMGKNSSKLDKSLLLQTKQQQQNNILNNSQLVQQHNTNLRHSHQLDRSMIMSTMSKNGMTNSKLVNQNLATQYLFDPQGVTHQTIRQFMIYLNLPDDKLGVQNRWRQVLQNHKSNNNNNKSLQLSSKPKRQLSLNQ